MGCSAVPEVLWADRAGGAGGALGSTSGASTDTAEESSFNVCTAGCPSVTAPAPSPRARAGVASRRSRRSGCPRASPGGIYPRNRISVKKPVKECTQKPIFDVHKFDGGNIANVPEESSKLMTSSNETSFDHPTFILTGIPGWETQPIWTSIPFCSMYILIILGNCTLLYVIQAHSSLHKPMYYFLIMLTLTDLVLTNSILPKMLGIFWFEAKEIYKESCLVQLFLVHTFCLVESGILVAMAFDRYTAICKPLRYHLILTGPAVAKVGLILLIRGTSLLTPHLVIMTSFTFCPRTVIQHTFCEFMTVVKQVCSDTSVLRWYSLSIALIIGGLDVLCIFVSYSLILRAVSSHTSRKAGLKALNTCSSHFCILVVFYITAIFSYLTQRFDHRIAPQIVVIVANMYPLIPPLMNPVIYGIKTKQFRDTVLQMFFLKEMGKGHAISFRQ